MADNGEKETPEEKKAKEEKAKRREEKAAAAAAAKIQEKEREAARKMRAAAKTPEAQAAAAAAAAARAASERAEEERMREKKIAKEQKNKETGAAARARAAEEAAELATAEREVAEAKQEVERLETEQRVHQRIRELKPLARTALALRKLEYDNAICRTVVRLVGNNRKGIDALRNKEFSSVTRPGGDPSQFESCLDEAITMVSRDSHPPIRRMLEGGASLVRMPVNGKGTIVVECRQELFGDDNRRRHIYNQFLILSNPVRGDFVERKNKKETGFLFLEAKCNLAVLQTALAILIDRRKITENEGERLRQYANEAYREPRHDRRISEIKAQEKRESVEHAIESMSNDHPFLCVGHITHHKYDVTKAGGPGSVGGNHVKVEFGRASTRFVPYFTCSPHPQHGLSFQAQGSDPIVDVDSALYILSRAMTNNLDRCELARLPALEFPSDVALQGLLREYGGDWEHITRELERELDRTDPANPEFHVIQYLLDTLHAAHNMNLRVRLSKQWHWGGRTRSKRRPARKTRRQR